MSEALSRGGGLFMSLINLSVKDFLKELASSSPAPGGGRFCCSCRGNGFRFGFHGFQSNAWKEGI